MPLDPKYVLAPSLQEFFIDKDSGLPMSGGYAYFFKDNARTIPKPVYEISGNPPNYGYTVLPNPVQFSAVGTFQDASGNDILPYWYPYDDEGNIDLYYVVVTNMDGVLQFTREGWPNTTTDQESVDQDITNFVPNGQFLLHNNVPASSANGYIPNKISQDVTVIAQGGWTFERTAMSTATDLVSFPEYSSITSPSGNPRFAVQIDTTVASGSDTRKDLCLAFKGVNTFASTTLSYNLYFEAQSLTGGSFNVQIIVRKFFGTGGSPSPTTETVIGTETLTPTVTSYNTNILFGTNVGKTLGTNNDDYVQIVLRLPPTGTQNGLFTDFALTIGAGTLSAFPTQAESQQLDASTAGWLPVPNPDGSDLFLPIILDQSGFNYDTSALGTIVSKMTTTAVNNEFLCNGQSVVAADYSAQGVPYYRLRDVLIASSPITNIPLFGTGLDFATSYLYTGTTNIIRVTNNSAGAGTFCSDGTTGWTFTQSVTGFATINLNAYNYSTAPTMSVQVYGANFLTPFSAINTHTSGFNCNDTTGAFANPYTSLTAENVYAAGVQTLAASTLTNTGSAAKYFSIANSTTTYNVWYFFTDETTPGGSNIQIKMPSTLLDQADVAQITREALNGYQVTSITVTAVPAAGQYFLMTTNPASPVDYYVWYKLGSIGADPSIGSATGILVNLNATGETTATVASKTMIAINAYQYAIPDLNGVFLRGVDGNGNYDIDTSFRWSNVSGLSGTFPGTYEYQQFLNHVHSVSIMVGTGSSTNTVGNNGVSNTGAYNTTTAITGGRETRPVNAYVNFFMKY